MRCKQAEFIQGEFFHIYNHAVHNENIFRNDNDYKYFLDKFKKQLQIIPASVIAYCLMPNHHHFFLRQDSHIPIFNLFDSSFRPYVIHYNAKYHRKGTLFQGPLQHIHIQTDTHLIQLCKYIHYNPVKAKLVTKPEDWKFSNYREWIGVRNNKLFSMEICDLYPDDFKNYQETMNQYSQVQTEKKLAKLIF